MNDQSHLPDQRAAVVSERADRAAARPDDPVHVSSAQARVAGRLWIVLAALMWSTSGLFAKADVFDDWAPDKRGALLAFWRAAFGGLLILPFVRRPRWSPQLVPMALAFATMNVTYLTAMVLTTAANAIWLQSTAPWWVFLLSVLVLREPASRAEYVPLLVGGLGIANIVWHEVAAQAPAGVACGLAAGMGYAVVVIFMRHLREHDSAWLVAVNHLATAAVLFPYILYLNVWPTPRQLLVLAAFGFFQMGLPYLCFARGLRRISSQEATGIALLEPLLLPIWVYLAQGEWPKDWTLIGGALIFAGLVLRYTVADREQARG